MILSNYPQVFFFFFNNYPQVLFVFDEFLFKNKKGKFLEICYWEFEWKVWKYPHKNGKDKKKKKEKETYYMLMQMTKVYYENWNTKYINE